VTSDSALVHTAAKLLDARIGLKPDASFGPRLDRALRDVAEARRIDRQTLVANLAADASLLDQLLDRITVQESAFFRHPEQFETIVRTVLPMIDAPLRAWSAACANGQEAYSLAMVLTEAGGTGSVLASDVSPAALRRTTAGYYHEREMRGVSAERRRRHFSVVDRGWQAEQSMRDMVSVKRHNLLDPIPPHVAECHVVMCRNVLIYFSQPHAELFLERLGDMMNPDAYLFVGGAETLWQMTDRFEPIQRGACFAYRARGRRVGRRVEAAHPALPVVQTTRTPTPPPSSSPAPRPSTEVTGEDQAQLGHRLLASGSVREAIVAFRQWAYLEPANPAAHLQLALALDSADERSTARRAYRAALTALDRCDPDRLVHVLDGYDRSELRRLLVDRSRTESTHPSPLSPGRLDTSIEKAPR
jgi:chemotaxis protein methyltransferase CheR